MNIHGYQIHNPNFGAEFVCPSHAMAKNSSGEYESFDTSIVKLDVTNKNDMATLKTVTKDWGKEYKKYNYGEHYSPMIYGIAKLEREHLKKNLYTNNHFYMMTTQDDNFEKLDAKKVLAETELFNSDGCENVIFEYVQVRPKYKYNGTSDRPVKKIGENFLADLTGEAIKKRGSLFSDQFSCWFYRTIGAEEDDEVAFSFVI